VEPSVPSFSLGGLEVPATLPSAFVDDTFESVLPMGVILLEITPKAVTDFLLLSLAYVTMIRQGAMLMQLPLPWMISTSNGNAKPTAVS
jgi:hypothetical protein